MCDPLRIRINTPTEAELTIGRYGDGDQAFIMIDDFETHRSLDVVLDQERLRLLRDAIDELIVRPPRKRKVTVNSVRKGDRFVITGPSRPEKEIRITQVENGKVWFIFEKKGEQAENYAAVWLGETYFAESVVKRLRR